VPHPTVRFSFSPKHLASIGWLCGCLFLLQIIIRDNRIIARAIMNATDTADADFLAHALVNVFASTKAIFEFLMLVIIDEVSSTGKLALPPSPGFHSLVSKLTIFTLT
jgi:hypothetical protein